MKEEGKKKWDWFINFSKIIISFKAYIGQCKIITYMPILLTLKKPSNKRVRRG